VTRRLVSAFLVAVLVASTFAVGVTGTVAAQDNNNTDLHDYTCDGFVDWAIGQSIFGSCYEDVEVSSAESSAEAWQIVDSIRQSSTQRASEFKATNDMMPS
jgi:hypothetical protein